MKIQLSDDDLRMRLRNSEDPFVERKTAGDIKDVLKSAVAFANSLPIGAPGVIFVPVKNDGSIQPNQNLDSLQIKISERLNNAYPQLPTLYKIFRDGDSEALAIIVWGSEQRPHFSGPAFIRDGSQTFGASEEMFRSLIAQRNSMVAEIERWKHKEVLVFMCTRHSSKTITGHYSGTVVQCNQFWISLNLERKGYHSAPLSRVQLSFEHQTDRLRIEIWDS